MCCIWTAFHYNVPKLGNGIVVEVGAVVVGGYIANNVAIGANAVVCTDVTEENIAVAGIPAKKISNNGRLEWNKRKYDLGYTRGISKNCRN